MSTGDLLRMGISHAHLIYECTEACEGDAHWHDEPRPDPAFPSSGCSR